MSRIQQDQFVDDDEEESCPLCVEEFDLSDKNFRPCPCGYQICQFCFNNIKTTMNGLCPACRRPYDESTIEFKNVSPEEMAKHKQQIAQKAKKNAAIRAKEAQKAEADSLSRKHLAGLRVVQKNLVYVTGLTPTIREDRLLDTLRGNDYFGQYGKIIKIVVSKARENAQHQQSVGVYVTFARKEDAAACIAAVDGSHNGDRTLRAQYGTTKYCSAYLRGEQCNNRNCMFLHEPGEENDSFTRQDLSMMNSIQTQQLSQSPANAAPPPHRGPSVAAAAAPMNRQDSSDAPSPIGDAPGLPATANWGSRAAQERRASRSTNASNPSPMTSNAVPAQASKPVKSEEPPKKKDKEKEKEREKEKEKEKERSAKLSTTSTPQPQPASAVRPPKRRVHGFDDVLKSIAHPDFKFIFSSIGLSPEDLKAISEFPCLLEPNGGAKRYAAKKEKELEALREAEHRAATQAAAAAAVEPEESIETTAGGSLQLGGEPEERLDAGGNRHMIAPPGQTNPGVAVFGQNASHPDDFSSFRSLTPSQQQQLLLSSLKSGGQQSAGLQSNFTANHAPQNPAQAVNAPQGHVRHASRFSFANDSSSASASVQPVANQKLMSQQSSMMPKNNNHFNQLPQHQSLAGQFYSSGVQGPPPGLKATGTPPVGGTGMFGQGHGFATGGLGYGANAAGRNNNDAMYQEMLRSRNMDGGARIADAGKRGGVVDVQDPSILQARLHQGGGMVGQGLYAGQGQDDLIFTPEEEATINVDALVGDTDVLPTRLSTPIPPQMLEQPRRATPTIPPGFTAPMANKGPTGHSSPPGTSGIGPTAPTVPATPIRAATPQNTQSTHIHSSSTAEPTTSSKAGPSTPSKVTRQSSPVKAQSIPEPLKKQVDEVPIIEQKEGKQSRSVSAAKSTPKSKAAGKKTQATPSQEASLLKNVMDSATPAATPTSTKRQPSGKLDLLAAAYPSFVPAPTSTKRQLPSKLDIVAATYSSSVPASPAATSTGSPIKRTTAPRTLRVVPTPKTEAPAPVLALSTPSVTKLRSRQASIASINQPGTPASELISEDASITSASVSRPSSPPPFGGKVGSAPVRKKTKSQTKKDRQDRGRQILEEQELAIDELTRSDPEPVQAPIMGRKKKAKKPVETPAAKSVAPVLSPPSPNSATAEEMEERSEITAAPTTASRNSQKTKASSMSPIKSPQSPSEDPKDKLHPSAQSIIADLQRTGELLASTLEFFKPLSSSLAHAARTSQATSATAPQDLKMHFSEGDLEALAKKNPVHLNGPDGKRTLITPQGKFFWGLTQELEEKALELEKHIEELKGSARFYPRQPESQSHTHHGAPHAQSNDVLPAIATALKEAGAKLGQGTYGGSSVSKLDSNVSTSTLPPVQLPRDGYSSMPWLDPDEPLNKPNERQHLPPVQAPQSQLQTPADAGAYLNQFVLPKTDNPSPNAVRTEMFAVGGPPGAGVGTSPVNVDKIAKAAKVVAEGGILSNELEGMGVMAADLLGGVVIQGLEALIGAGLGFHGSHDVNADGQGNIRLGSGLDVQGLVDAIGSGGGLGGFGGGHVGRRGRRNVLSINEAEQAMMAAKKEHESLEKKLATLIKRNKKVVVGQGKA